jgi:acyl-[acyl-carrier-protein] desaturase
VDDDGLLCALAPTAERLFDRHLRMAKEWFPHEMVPWERGCDIVAGQPWDPSACPIPDGLRSALYINLLTEDNLPYYFRTIDDHFGTAEVFRAWNRRWTAEEARHGIVLREYLTVTQAIDPIALERARMAQMSAAIVPEPPSVADTLGYVALQELATRISHRNTGKLLEDEAGFEIMARVATDENLHHIFYRDLVSAAFEIDPSGTMQAVERQVREFKMPGVGIIDFAAHAAAVARLGIYDFQVHHEQILVGVVLRHWKVDERAGLDAEGERARDELLRHIERLGRVTRRLAGRRPEVLSTAR